MIWSHWQGVQKCYDKIMTWKKKRETGWAAAQRITGGSSWHVHASARVLRLSSWEPQLDCQINHPLLYSQLQNVSTAAIAIAQRVKKYKNFSCILSIAGVFTNSRKKRLILHFILVLCYIPALCLKCFLCQRDKQRQSTLYRQCFQVYQC